MPSFGAGQWARAAQCAGGIFVRMPSRFDAILCAEGRVMIVIYIAGPFRANGARAVEQNIRRAEDAAYGVWARGHAAMCPHANARWEDPEIGDQVFLDGTLELMRRCDAVLVLPYHQASEGTKGEIAEAKRLGMPVAYLEGLTPFDIQMRLFDIEHAIEMKKATDEGKRTHG